MLEKKKFQKRVDKKCPDCDSINSMELFEHIETIDGVEYTESYLECKECGYSEKQHKSQKKYTDKDGLLFNKLNKKW
jgi:Zn ribbon nucleic-acid-binding protein